MPYNLKDINQLAKEKNQNYIQIIYTPTTSITYICQAEITGNAILESSPVWRIKKIETVSATEMKTSFADFSDTFDKIATSYDTYTYLT